MILSVRATTVLLLLLAALTAAQIAWYLPRLPPRVASHFDGSGTPNGWSTPRTFAVTHAFVFGVLLVTLGGIPFALPLFPDSSINLPNKDYWLAPERRARTMATIGAYVQAIAVGALLLVAIVIQATVRANLVGSPRLPAAAIGPVIAVFVILELGIVVAMSLRFRRPAA